MDFKLKDPMYLCLTVIMLHLYVLYVIYRRGNNSYRVSKWLVTVCVFFVVTKDRSNLSYINTTYKFNDQYNEFNTNINFAV